MLFLQNKGSLQQYTDQLEQRQFKDTRKEMCARCWQTCMLTEILRSCAHRGGRVNPLALYIFFNPSISMYMKQSARCFFGDKCSQRPAHLKSWILTADIYPYIWLNSKCRSITLIPRLDSLFASWQDKLKITCTHSNIDSSYKGEPLKNDVTADLANNTAELLETFSSFRCSWRRFFSQGTHSNSGLNFQGITLTANLLGLERRLLLLFPLNIF